jgi:Xaa-Pro aminopeptidase
LAILEETLRPLLPQGARLGIESGPGHLPGTYASHRDYDNALSNFLHTAFTEASLAPADMILRELRARPSRHERERIRAACLLAGRAFEHGMHAVTPGLTEMQAVLPLRHALGEQANAATGLAAADSFFYCMSGPNAALAWGAFQHSTRRRLAPGEPVLVHCNAHADGYWTDLTRTYAFGTPDSRLAAIWNVLAEARAAACAAVRPGVPACAADRAARAVLERAGHGQAFRHPTGHGVGFAAIDHDEAPCIHPANGELLEEGMVFNIEPGVYLDGWGGVRDCNVVAVTDRGCELLSPFQLDPRTWRLPA